MVCGSRWALAAEKPQIKATDAAIRIRANGEKPGDFIKSSCS
jgi:hypothetical protein